LKQSILELAIIQKDWKKILELWPRVNLKECTFPVNMHYIVEELNEQSRIFIYLVELDEQKNMEQMDKIIPYLPFCFMMVDELDKEFEALILKYQQRYETPLFLVLPDDERLKDRIASISRFEAKLPEFIVMETADSFHKTIVKLVKNILEKLNEFKPNTIDQQMPEDSNA